MSLSTQEKETQRPTIGIDVGGTLVKGALTHLQDSLSYDSIVVMLVTESENTPNPEDYDRHAIESFILRWTSAKPDEVPSGWQAQVIRRKSRQISKDHVVSDKGIVLRILVFPTANLEQVVSMIAAQRPSERHIGRIRVAATGGGALRFRHDLETKLDIDMEMVNELKAVSYGWWSDVQDADTVTYPALLCNVGTGVSMISVDKDGGFERVSGSGLGGATFWGLAKRMTKFSSFNECILAAHREGDAGRADTLVGDIYGVKTSKEIGMPADLVAGFLGKADSENITDSDIAAALLRMVTNNLGQLVVFQARAMGIGSVWFTGGFFQQHVADVNRDAGTSSASDSAPVASVGSIVQNAASEAVNFWSAGKIQPLFSPDASILGALGAVAALSSE
ncbi:hypothetical protein LPJ53_001722 [Coemansia erecta]|uniref:Fumble n=1 Tax=Coemansia erecta TaxID=147472 RepID=A0A9W7Y2T5_9FUNG|nr:hypothetical protein LPJ53_001722 [Coemansia erecta]